jgi:hypothetical protein
MRTWDDYKEHAKSRNNNTNDTDIDIAETVATMTTPDIL